MSRHPLALALAVLPILAGPAAAQNQATSLVAAATIAVAESDEHGPYLTDGDGRSVYLFKADTRGEEGTPAVSACADECLAAWPPVTTRDPPEAGEGVQADLLGTIADDTGLMQVTYAGWPLYYYHEDTEPGQTNGHDIEEFGAEWYLLTPEGEKVGEEHEDEEE